MRFQCSRRVSCHPKKRLQECRRDRQGDLTACGEFRVESLAFGVEGLGFMVQGPGFCVPSFHFLVATHLKDVDQRVTRSNCDPRLGASKWVSPAWLICIRTRFAKDPNSPM